MEGVKRLCWFVFLAALLSLPSLASAAVPRSYYPAQSAEANSAPVILQGTAPQAAAPSSVASPGDYVLGTGDRVKLTIYGEADLSGEYEVSSTGVVSLPLIGSVQAARRTIHDFEQAVRSKLSEGYLKDPRVSAQVINYRPFFILGEVSKPGSYPYVNGMTVVNAVALAGGYTYRADKDDATITRANDPEKKDVKVSEDTQVMPGDVIRVPERYF
ncbi:MAG: polysaccharide biosynthesis/export family protein [Bdellovibrionales bacterium]